MTNQKTDWQAVTNHLAVAVMGWRKSGEAYVDKYNCCKEFVADWQPHKKWRYTGRVIDKMKERFNYLLDINIRVFSGEPLVSFRDDVNRIRGRCNFTEEYQEAIALAAAIATGYVEQEKTEVEILLDKLFKEGLYCMKDTEKHILELFEQSFERVREDKAQEQAEIIEELRQIDKKKNDEGALLMTIRKKLDMKCKGGWGWSELNSIEQSILRSIVEWEGQV